MALVAPLPLPELFPSSTGYNLITNHRPAHLRASLSNNCYAALLQACTNIESLKQIHAHMLRSGLDQNYFLYAKLVSMYAMCGAMENARLLFDRIHRPNDFLWNMMIRGYATEGPLEEALTLYYQMQWAGVWPDKFTFPFVLKACAGLSALQEGKETHCHIMRGGLELDVFVGNSLIAMYAKCGCLDVARQVFDRMSQRDVVSWTAMTVGYVQSGRANEALTVFRQMHLADVVPDGVTLVSVLPACAQLAALQQGEGIHGYVIKSGFLSDICVWNSLIDMYAKCGRICSARQLFEKMSSRDAVSWGAMIGGYAQHGHAGKALTLFRQMQLSDVTPDSVAMVSMLPACAHLAALQHGKCIHGYIIRRGFESDLNVGNALVDMYAKCGSIVIARQVFDKMSKRDTVSWNAMIAGYGMNGQGENALELFAQMQQMGTRPDHITFVGVLSACSHAGLVDEGLQYYDFMITEYCIAPTMEHYACMADLLARAGRLNEAVDFIENIPLEPGVGVWGALLGACRIHCNIELGERVAERLFDLEPENSGNYVLLSNIYAEAGRWDDVARVRTNMKERGVKKTPGCSLIEVNNRVYEFLVGDRSHPQSKEIYAVLEALAGQMKEEGYVPNTNFVLHDVEEDAKEHMLSSHSEKLAIAFGLITTSPGTPIRITKNLRVCGDCHSASKFISKITRREIIVRDANRFHHFKDGLCSCADYW